MKANKSIIILQQDHISGALQGFVLSQSYLRTRRATLCMYVPTIGSLPFYAELPTRALLAKVQKYRACQRQ